MTHDGVLVSENFQILYSIMSSRGNKSYPDISTNIEQNEEKLVSNLDQLKKTGLITTSPLSAPRCHSCNEILHYSMGSFICHTCDMIIENTAPEAIKYSSCSLDYNCLVDHIKEELENQSIKTMNIPSNFHLNGFVPVANLSINGSKIFMVLAKSIPDINQINALMGYSLTNNEDILLVHTGLKSDGISILKADSIEPKILTLDLQTIFTEKNVFDYTKSYFNNKDIIANRVANIEAMTGYMSVPHSKETMDFIEKIQDKSKSGRDSFQEYALLLLLPFGSTAPFKKKQYHPDGVLILQDGFWIVDPKSSDTYFKFDISEKDKVKRYMDTIIPNQTKYPKDKFYGEIIVAPSLPLSKYSSLNSVIDYFNKIDNDCSVVIFSADALIWLYQRICENFEYFYRYDPKHHFNKLTSLSNDLLPDEYNTDPTLNKLKSTKVRYINQSLIEKYWKYVMDSEYYQASRDPNIFVNSLSKLYSRNN